MAVQPTNATTARSNNAGPLTAPESPMQLVESEAHERDASVRIAVRMRGREEPVHQRLHLGFVEHITGARGRVAGVRARDAFDALLLPAGASVLAQPIEHVLQQRAGALVPEPGWHALDHHRRRPERREIPAELFELWRDLEQQIELTAGQIHQRRKQQPLR